MRIDSLRISVYRSVYDVSIRPGSLNVLAGSNGAGKSNFVDAIDFLSDVYRNGLELAVLRKGGFESIAFRRKRRTKKPISFEVRATIDIESELELSYRSRLADTGARSLTFAHSFGIGASSSARATDFGVVAEQMTVWVEPEAGRRRFRLFKLDRGERLRLIPGSSERFATSQGLAHLRSPTQDRDYREFVTYQTNSTDLAIENLVFNSAAAAFSRGMTAIRMYQLSPLVCREPGVPTPNAEIGRNGSNLPALVELLRKDQSRGSAWFRIIKSMRRVLPDLTDIGTTFNSDGRLVLQFHESSHDRPWSANEVSDGTVQSLALFCVLFDKRSSTIAIEEPENSLHPWIIRVFLDACRESRKQVFMTTHSPVVLDLLEPSEALVVWKANGETRVEGLIGLEPDANRMWADGEIGVFDLLDTGWLREYTPGNQ